MAETTLLERLRSSDLLSAEQLQELSGLPEAHEPDPKVLAKAVLQRGWLTKFQISQTAMGKGKDLLVGPYVLLDRLGEGGMGQVFKARHRHMKRIVALKLIRKEKLANEDAVQRFYQEIEAAAQLTHPNIVHGLRRRAGRATCTSSRWNTSRGPTWPTWCARRGRCPSRRRATSSARRPWACSTPTSAAWSIATSSRPTCWSRLADKPVVKILDMGLARLGDTFAKERNLTKMGQVLGTPDYLAPEQAIDARHVDIRADIYSLGCSLFYLLTRRAPFQAESLAELLMKHQMEEPTPLRSLRPDAPAALEDLLRRMLAKKPAQRPSTPAEVAAALAPFARGEKGAGAAAVPVAVALPSASVGGDTFAGLTDDGGGGLIARPPAALETGPDPRREARPAAHGQEGGRAEEQHGADHRRGGRRGRRAGAAAGSRPGPGPGRVEDAPDGVANGAPGQGSGPDRGATARSARRQGIPPPPKEEPPLQPVVDDAGIFAAVEQAVREGRTRRTGSRGGQATFEEVPSEGAVLVGLKLGLGKFIQQDIISSIQPIFLTRKGERIGELRGTATNRVVTVQAKAGYAVGGIRVKTGLYIDGMSLTFMAIEGQRSTRRNPMRASGAAGKAADSGRSWLAARPWSACSADSSAARARTRSSTLWAWSPLRRRRLW